MTLEQKTLIDSLKRRPDEIMEQCMTAACDLCHLPYTVSDQEDLDDRCEACPVGKLLVELREEGYKAGHAAGMVEAGILAVEAAKSDAGGENAE